MDRSVGLADIDRGWRTGGLGMGRAKGFCVESALGRALEVFWRHGFEGASMSALTAAMGITRPSLYATYGNKETLFRRALDLYDERHMAFTREALEAATSREAAMALLLGFAHIATDAQQPRGSMDTNGTLACSTAADPIKAELVRRRGLLENALHVRLERARAEGDLPEGQEPADLARYVMTVACGITVQAAGGATREALERTATVALQVWPARPSPAGAPPGRHLVPA